MRPSGPIFCSSGSRALVPGFTLCPVRLLAWTLPQTSSECSSNSACAYLLLLRMLRALSAMEWPIGLAITPLVARVGVTGLSATTACVPFWPPEPKRLDCTLRLKNLASCRPALTRTGCLRTEFGTATAAGLPMCMSLTGECMARPLSTWPSPQGCATAACTSWTLEPGLRPTMRLANAATCKRKTSALHRASSSSRWWQKAGVGGDLLP